MTKNCDFMILDNYAQILILIVIIMHECGYSFMVLFTRKSRQYLAPPATHGLLQNYKAVTAMVSKKLFLVAKTIYKFLFQ